MSIWKKAVSVGTTAALLASLLVTAVAPSALAAGAVNNIVYQANGAVAGSAVAPSATVAFVSFNPESALQAGTNITLTLPSGTTVAAAPTFSMVQAPTGVVTAATTSSVVGNVVTILIPAAAIGAIGGGVTIFYTGGGAITNPTTATSNGTLGIAIQSGDTGTLTGITFVGGPVASIVITPAPTASTSGALQFSAACADAFANPVPCGTVTWAAVAGTGTGSIDAAGLYTPTTVGTVSVTGTANAIISAATVVTNVAAGASVTCTPSGGTIAAGGTVVCAFSAGFPPLGNPTWTQTNFTPAGPVVAPGATFTAVNTGTVPVTGTITVSGSINAVFSYTISPSAPSATGTWPGTSAGNVAQGTTSTGTATLLLTENAKAALQTTGTMTVTIVPKAPGVGTVVWAGTPVLSAPDSLGATLSIVGNQLNIKITGRDDANVETISISGLKITASSDASPGDVVARLSDNAGGLLYPAFLPTTATATGKLAQAYGVGTTVWTVAVDSTSPCDFVGTNDVTIGSETRTVVAPGPTAKNAAGQQTFTTQAFGVNHLANEVVTQKVPNCAVGLVTGIGSPATVVTALKYTSSGDPTVYPGENNSRAGNLQVLEPAAGFLKKDTTLTYTISTAGVVFSKAPTVFKTGNIGVSAAVLSADRKSVVVTVTAASTGAASNVWLGDINGAFGPSNPILYDVAANVPGGTFVTVGLALSGGLLSDKTTRTNAVVFRGITATAPTPNVFIGENNQATGLVTLVESAAGFFQAGTGANNTLTVCPLAVNYAFTFAPWAKVTAGDLKLREGDVASTDNIVEGKVAFNGCYQWTVWTASTAASTIVIGNSTFTSGPLINVTPAQAPGTVLMDVYSGDGGTIQSLIATVGFANATYRNQVAVTALSQPFIAPGAVNAPAGDIQIAETGIGQLKNNETICVEVLWRAGESQDQFLNSLATADLPIATASGGVVVGPVTVNAGNSTCQGISGPTIPAGYMRSFSFTILQQSTSGTGKVVISNMRLTTLTDSGEGPVQLSVWGLGGSPTNVIFRSTVSNAIVGTKSAIAMSTVTALGVPPNQGPWSTSTKVAAANKFITWRFSGGAALAGKTVRIYVAAKNANGGWGPFVDLTGRVADASGNVYFWWRATDAWYSVRAYFPGDASYAPSWSTPRQGRWLS